jgi:hypothetical protein
MDAPASHRITLASGEAFFCREDDESVFAAMRRANAGRPKADVRAAVLRNL